ncbi:MAG: PAS domain-containing hybrid sensor histidine kinase/response regulator [Sphingobacteriaceae bacterium]|nr:MAG: PAS domain-containing hybrid sensor histidine kinase/response regulator [Sphingobacteriaceae bacterium]
MRYSISSFYFLLYTVEVFAVNGRDWKAFQKVFVDMPDETMFIDSNLIIRAVSRIYCSHIKPPILPEAIVGTSITDIAVGRVNNEGPYLNSIREALRTGVKSTILTNDILGSQYEMDNIPIQDAKGTVYAIKHQIKHVILHTSVEYLRLLQTESEKSSWKTLVLSLTDYAIFVVSNDFVIQTWSEQCEKVYQWKEEEVLGKYYYMLSNGLEGDESPSVSQTENAEESVLTVSHKRKNGLTFLVEEKIFPIYSHGVHVGNSVINKDLTAMTHSQAMLLEAREQSQKLQNNFLSSISHESRSNTAIIVSSIETLLDPTTGTLNPFQRETCEDVHQASRMLLQVVDDILDHASFTKVGIHLKMIEFDISKLVLGVMKLQARSLKRKSGDNNDKLKSIELTCYVDPNIPSILYGDDIRVSQIITNLVSNGIKFTDKGSVKVRVEREPPLYTDKTNILISVQDTGVGISEAQQPLLFSPFYQADAGLSRKQTGTGLGLSNVKMLAEAMSGVITVTSIVQNEDATNDHGSTFRCHIHLLHRKPNCEPEDTNVAGKPKYLSRQRSYSVPELYLDAPLMLVEDNTVLAKFALRALSSLGFSNVKWVDDGLEAVEEARIKQKDLILMDLHMPKMDGLEAARRIRLFDKRVAIIALTANALQQDKQMCLDAGMQHHLSKPISVKDLKDTIVLFLSKIASDDNEQSMKMLFLNDVHE